METAMSSKPMCCAWAGGAAFALAILVSTAVSAAQSDDSVGSHEPIVVAQNSTPAAAARSAGTTNNFPPYQRGVRKAAAEGPEALRRYIWRTRMIYNFYYHDFAPKE
jgi:hypothetical protein